MTLNTHPFLTVRNSTAARAKAVAALAVAGAVLAAPAPSLAAGKPGSVLGTVRAVRTATDNSNLIVERDASSHRVQGHPAYAVYSDRKLKVSATYLQGLLSGQGLGDVQYAANGKCFVSHRFPQFVGLTEIGDQLLPQAGAHYTLSDRTLRWTIAALKAPKGGSGHSQETGTVTFNRHHQITTSDAASYKLTGAKVHGEVVQATTVTFTYPTSLPSAVPTKAPKVCEK